MKPVKFPESNVVFGQYQKEYQPLPALRAENGDVITCWKLSFTERLKVLFFGKVWLSQLTFNSALQPQLLSADKYELILPRGTRCINYGKYVCSRMRVRVQEGYLAVHDRYTLQYRFRFFGRHFWITGEEFLHLPFEKEELFPAYVFQALMQKRAENSLKNSAERRRKIAFIRRYAAEMHYNDLNSPF